MKENNLFDKDVEEYEEWFQTNDKLFDSELEVIKQLIPISGNGIEIGAGTGIFASKLGIQDGVEPSEKMATKASKKGLNILHGTAEKIPVDDESYQFALMVTVDCFLKDVPKAFSEIHRILVRDGVFIIAFLDKATPLGQLYEKNKHMHESYKNANFHSSEEMTVLLNNAGFEIIKRKQTIYTLDNKYQESKSGFGEGVFAVIKAKRD